jgi:ankyrin repeat protein
MAGESTPLSWLPDDEATAKEIVELLLAHGADPAFRRKDGKTAADVTRERTVVVGRLQHS